MKMFVTYKPEGAQEQVWEFDPDKVRASEAEMVEKRYGGQWGAWTQGVQAGAARARRVLLWHLIRRDGHVLKYEDTPDFLMSELLVEHSVAELLVLRDRLGKAKLTDEEREVYETGMDIELTEAMRREGLDDELDATSPVELDGESPKASKRSGKTTGSTSRTTSTSPPDSSTS